MISQLEIMMCYLPRLVLIKYWYYITHHINRNIFLQSYALNENLVSSYGLEFILNNTSNEHDLQSAYNGNGFLGIIASLQQVFLAMCGTAISP